MRFFSFVVFVLFSSCLLGEGEERSVGRLEQALLPTFTGSSGTVYDIGVDTLLTLNHSDGFSYNYYVYLPAGFNDAGDPYPILVNFHGGFESAYKMKNKDFMTELKVKADEEGLVLVWVDSSSLFKLWKNNLSRGALLPNDHEGMVSALIAELDAEFHVQEKPHLLGFSDGAVFAQYLVVQMPTTFASVTSVAGITGEFYSPNLTGSSDPLDPYHPDNVNPTAVVPVPFEVWSIWPDHTAPAAADTPVLIIRGDNDTVFSHLGGDMDEYSILRPKYANTFPVFNLINTDDSDFEAWSKALGCTEQPELPLNQGGIRIGWRHRCTGGAAHMRVEIYDGLEHKLPALGNIGIDGPKRVMQFILDHP